MPSVTQEALSKYGEVGGEEDERADCSFFKPIKTEAHTLALTLTSCIMLFSFFKIYLF